MNATTPGRTLLTLKTVCERTGLSRYTVYRQVASGAFPRPIYPAERTPRWPSDEVDAWIEALMADREAAA